MRGRYLGRAVRASLFLLVGLCLLCLLPGLARALLQPAPLLVSDGANAPPAAGSPKPSAPAAAAVAPPSAAAAPPAAPRAPTVIRVGVYLLNVGKLDIGAGTYAMDLYVSFRCDSDCNPGNFDILNGRVTAEKNDDDPRFKVYRLRGELMSQFDLRWFPFDAHRLSISIEDRLLQDTQLVYEPDLPMTGIHPSAVVVGWQLDPNWQVRVDRDSYAVYGQSYSRITFSIGAHRPRLSAFLKNLTPALIIALSGFLALLMGADKATPRLTLTTSSLVGAVLFHINMTSSMPPIGYLTFADRFMLINYIGLVTVLIVNVRVLAISESGVTDLSQHALGRIKYYLFAAFFTAHLLHTLSLR